MYYRSYLMHIGTYPKRFPIGQETMCGTTPHPPLVHYPLKMPLCNSVFSDNFYKFFFFSRMPFSTRKSGADKGSYIYLCACTHVPPPPPPHTHTHTHTHTLHVSIIWNSHLVLSDNIAVFIASFENQWSLQCCYCHERRENIQPQFTVEYERIFIYPIREFYS